MISDSYKKEESQGIAVEKIKELKREMVLEKEQTITRETQIEKNMNDKFASLSNEITASHRQIIHLLGGEVEEQI